MFRFATYLSFQTMTNNTLFNVNPVCLWPYYSLKTILMVGSNISLLTILKRYYKIQDIFNQHNFINKIHYIISNHAQTPT